MANNLFDKNFQDKYDSKTTLSADMNRLLEGLPPESREGIAKDIVSNEYGHSKIKTIGGFIIMSVGVLLMILGINGVINFDLKIGEITAKLINVSPGVFVFFGGGIIVTLSGTKAK
jgi:hypothetical protein